MAKNRLYIRDAVTGEKWMLLRSDIDRWRLVCSREALEEWLNKRDRNAVFGGHTQLALTCECDACEHVDAARVLAKLQDTAKDLRELLAVEKLPLDAGELDQELQRLTSTIRDRRQSIAREEANRIHNGACAIAALLRSGISTAGPSVKIEDSDLEAWASTLEGLVTGSPALYVFEPDSAPEPAPIPMYLNCPACRTRHIDVGEFATKVHHTHACQSCGLTWRPAVVPTVGVHFLPGFSNDETTSADKVGALLRDSRFSLRRQVEEARLHLSDSSRFVDVFMRAYDAIGIDESDLARAVGVERCSVSKWKRGKHVPHKDARAKILDLMLQRLDVMLKV